MPQPNNFTFNSLLIPYATQFFQLNIFQRLVCRIVEIKIDSSYTLWMGIHY